MAASASWVAFGLGGVLVEVLKDITFRLAPAHGRCTIDARRNSGGGNAERRPRREPVNREAVADLIGTSRGSSAISRNL